MCLVKDMYSKMPCAEADPHRLACVLFRTFWLKLYPKTYACLVNCLQWSSNGCSADCKSVAFGVGGSNPSHCKKDVYCMILQNILGVTGSIPVSPNYGTVAQNGRARGVVTARKGTHLVLAEDTYSNF